jgi:hypothetical protein
MATITQRVRHCGLGQSSTEQLVWSLLFFGSLSVVAVVTRHLSLPFGVKLVLPGCPLVAGFFYIRALIRDIRRQSDELQLRIYLEAAAMAICGLFVVMLSYSTMQEAGWVGPLDYPLVVMLLISFSAIGYVVARRRYR